MSNDEEKKEFPVLDTGAYRCTLRIKEAEVATWDRKNNCYNNDKTRPGFRLVFKTAEAPEAYITTEIANTSHEKGNVVKYCRQLYDSSLSMVQFGEDNFAQDPVELLKLFHALSDYEFMVKAEKKTSQKGNEYHKFIDAAPINVPRPEQVVENKQMEFDDDSIPF